MHWKIAFLLIEMTVPEASELKRDNYITYTYFGIRCEQYIIILELELLDGIQGADWIDWHHSDAVVHMFPRARVLEISHRILGREAPNTN